MITKGGLDKFAFKKYDNFNQTKPASSLDITMADVLQYTKKQFTNFDHKLNQPGPPYTASIGEAQKVMP